MTVQKAVKRLGLESKEQLLPGMEVTLMDHQLMGVSWMVEQEAKVGFKGGCLGDDMGLGKVRLLECGFTGSTLTLRFVDCADVCFAFAMTRHCLLT